MLPGGTQVIQLGDFSVTILDIYVIPEKLSKLIDAPAEEMSQGDTLALDRVEDLPVQCILVRGPGISVLVDAGDYEASFDAAKRSNYNPPDLLSRLAQVGARPEDIGHVVVTHGHGDHYNALTVARGDERRLAFPNATCYIGKGDWEKPERQAALAQDHSLDGRTLGVLHRHGRLTPVDGDRDLAPGVTIVATPGETPGHQALRVRSGGKTLYCIGDLYHHPIEVVHPTWMVPWADRAANLQSRGAISETALGEDALLVATHIRGVGRLQRTTAGVEWVDVT